MGDTIHEASARACWPPVTDVSARRLTGDSPDPQRLALTSQTPKPAAAPRKFFIHGITVHGRRFRPSDWAERLCGVMSGYRPGGAGAGRDTRIGFSPYCRPTTVGGVKCVIVDERLRDIERMAFDFVMNFARDNELQIFEGCELPEPPQT